jgi:hypothetical protein
MPFLRPLVSAAVVAAALTIGAPAGAGPLDACAQRVIRDWYSGGRIDGMYPLACYRAAIRALPEDVLQYSNADKDIARALAYAQRGRRDPGNGPPASSTGPHPAREPAAAPPATTRSPATPAPGPGSPASRNAPRPEPRGPARAYDGPVRLASAPDAETAGAGLPYPVLALATLAALLLLSAAAAALRARRR